MKIETKSILAKLLATENISVEQKEIPTAAFDPTKRVLYIPNWKDMSNSLQDLLIGHEVGHAWDTPAEGWHDAICEDPTLKGFLNVIEDARIERKIKSRYPGLVKSFYAGYRELFERDFFGVKDVDVNSLPLIDRINLHFKVGPFLSVKFSADEQVIVDRVSKTDTWEDVEAIARELHTSAQEDADETLENITDMFDELMEDLNEMDEDSGESAGDEESDTEQLGGSDATESSDDSDELEDAGFSGNNQDEFDKLFSEAEQEQDAPQEISKFTQDGGVGSITDNNFRDNEQRLVDTSPTKKETVYVTIPKNINAQNYIVSAKDIYKFENFKFYTTFDNKETIPDYADRVYKEFSAKSKSTVNQMASAFEMKRKAALYIKAKTAKSGDLDDKRLWAYKTSDNLFKQITSIPEGKNHGMVMYLDMSGSMSNSLSGTIDQLINLGMFCNKVNIPFEVYGFTSNDYAYKIDTTEIAVEGEMDLTNAKLIHLLSSSFTKQQTEMAYKCLLLWRESLSSRGGKWRSADIYCESRDLRLSATPLNATIVLAMDIANKFRAANNIEKFSTIFLTDGGATDGSPHWCKSKFGEDAELFSTGSGWEGNVHTVFKLGSSVIPMYEEGFCHRNTKITATLIDLYKDVTGSTAINYHLLPRWSRRELEDCRDLFSINNRNDMYTQWDNLISNRSSGLIEVKDTTGFDVRYLVKSANLELEDAELEVKSNAKGDLLRGFKKFAGNKAQSRVFVQKFIPQVA